MSTYTVLEEGTTVDRGPSDFGSDEFVRKYLTCKMVIGVDRSKERWHLEYPCAKNACHVTPSMCAMSPKNSRRKLSWHFTNPRNSQMFSPSKVSRYNMVHHNDVITPHTSARGNVIGRVIVVHTKIARSRLLGVSASVQYGHNVEYGKKLMRLCFKSTW